MAESSNLSETKYSSSEDLSNAVNDDDMIKLAINEMIRYLDLDNSERRDEILNELLENGRQSLTKYEEDFTPRIYSGVMKGNNNKLLKSLKSYFEQQWKVLHESSNRWFILFLEQYQHDDNYEIVLNRTAEYGNKYMKTCPILSIVLQLLFDDLDDKCFNESNVFNDLWFTITNDGLKSIGEYSNYIKPSRLNELIKKEQLVLFQALREFYRPELFKLLNEANIKNRENLYELILNNVTEYGWLTGLEKSRHDIIPKYFTILLEKIPSSQKRQQTKPSKVNDDDTISTSKPSDIPKKTGNEPKPDEFDGADDTRNIAPEVEIDGPANRQIFGRNSIFITGLPLTMSGKRLFDALRDVFSTVGEIKSYKQTNKPSIYLVPQKDNRFQLTGSAMITFEKEESAMEAVEKYNETSVPLLNDARIHVKLSEIKSMGSAPLPMPKPTLGTGPVLQKYSKKAEDTNPARDRNEPRPDEFDDADDTRNIAPEVEIDGPANRQIFGRNSIFITGLPLTMSGKRLFDALRDVFSTVGGIKSYKQTNKPSIYLVPQKDNRFQLTGNATITFEKEESAMEAVEKYNGKRVPMLNDAQIFVKKAEMKTDRRTASPISLRPQLPEPDSGHFQKKKGMDQPDGPVTVFWDIENVAIPFGQNVFDIVTKLRQWLIVDRNLVVGAFTTYCDATSLSKQHRRGLNDANVTIKDIVNVKRGDVDRAIYKDLQSFKEHHKIPATIVLLSGDIDFIQCINDLRFSHKHYIIIIHNLQAKEELLKTANEAIPWQEFTRMVIGPSAVTSNLKSLVPSSRRLIPSTSYNPSTALQPVVVNKDSSPAIVYIPDLPGNKNDTDLAKVIRSRLQDAHRIQVSEVQCFSNLGVGIIHLTKHEDKDYLVDNLQCIFLFPNDGIKVTCTKKLEVTSYIVFDKNATLPNNDTIARRWIDLFPSSHRPQFRTLSIQFPNIIKVTSFSIEELQAVAKQRVFEVEHRIARIHTHVDCSYLEELPHLKPALDENLIFCFITTQLNMNDRARTDKELCQEQANTLFQQIQSLPVPMKELKSQFYIQYDKQSSNAIILASDSLHKWISMTFLNINGQLIFKTADISSKLIIKPIPLDFPLRLIFDHPIFNNSIKTDVAKLNGEHLVVEINDKRTYDECLKIGAFEVISSGDRLTLRILPYTIVENPDNSDINVENWYGTQMQKYKPDITQFDSRHPVFRYKWNPSTWLDQFMRNKNELEQITNQDERRQNDFFRRMLRVTVMLNTMATMRKRKYILEDSPPEIEVLIEPPSSLVTVLYNHQSKLTRSGQTCTPPFRSTNVRVLNEDCLISYSTLVSSGMKPLLLNMANETTPGGGYRKGDGAQEENIFRRSNYYMSLDYKMDPEQDQYINSKRNHCSSTGQISPLPVLQSLYPIAEYGAIYTSGITAFRGTEDQGYPFLKRPLYDVCAVAIAAYRDPRIQKNKRRVTLKIAVGTRKKIETLFAIAYKSGHDSLVLSAFGCGAFKNPPEHIALIFKSVILQYAGFFKEIVFSVIDDHNTGRRLNPDGNFLPFQQVLDKFVAHTPTNQTVGMSFGPHRLIHSKSNKNSTTIQEFIVCDIPPCEKAAYCENLTDQNHCHTYSHPPLCPLDSECNENTDDVHCQMFIHRKKCSNGGQCLVTDARHLADFDHPSYCPQGGHCDIIRMDHLNLYQHVPICEKGFDCDHKLKRNAEHLMQFRHCQSPCEFGGNCVRFHDQKHIANKYHPFNRPCPYTPFSCEMYNKFLQSNNEQNKSKNRNELDETQKHCYHYSHICPWGRLCNDKSEAHLSMTIHIIRHMCPNEDSCNQMMKEDHIESFSHSDVRDIRFLCRYSGSECPDRFKAEHIIKYRHNYMLDYLGVAQYFSLNKHINFIQNQSKMTQMICNYVKETCKQAWNKVSVPKDLLEWIDALQPVHRCNASIFESILVHGHIMSRSYMERLKDSTFVGDTVDQHKRVRKILASHGPALQKDAREFIEALVRKEFNKNGIHEKGGDDNELLEYRIYSKEKILKLTLSTSDLEEIRVCISQIVQASIKLHSKKTGIGHEGDLVFGTNQQIFSILGPNTASYYGDIVIVVKRDIMLHPDANFTMQAATMYKKRTYSCRPWINDSGSDEGHVKQFHSTKLHCSVPGYAYVTALELMAITGAQKQTMNVGLDDIIYRWKQIDSHQVIEGHLPQLIPLRYIDHIYMPRNVFESLSSEAQKNARVLFPHNLTITKYVVDLNIDLIAFSKPDDSRKDYHNHVIDQVLKSIEKQQKQNAVLSTSQLLTSYGMTVTIPATNFETCITNLLTIEQSYNQYLDQSPKTSKSDDAAYIYWKAIGGDFMLILTNEMIEVGKIQSDLVYLTCYIAPFDTNTYSDINYNEGHTYINHSSPTAHGTVLEGQHFKIGSNTFHKGCNPNDYILYCLKLNPEKGKISLMNAGVNGIYNHTILKCTFERSELDLTSLNYIHVTAGRQSVSIRNLVIRHELIDDAHPKFDKGFVSRVNDSTHDDSQTIDVKSTKTEDNDDQSMFSRLSQPLRWIKNKILPNAKDSLGMDEDDDNDELEEHSQMDDLTPCKDSIYCLDQYFPEKSTSHNQNFSHPCRFTDSCQRIHRMPHCIQFTHNKHDASKCHQDVHCKQVIDPIHRYSYRHTDLPDLLYPCRNQQRCRNSSFEHQKKYFHGEQINLTVIKHIRKDVSKSESSHSTQSYHTAQQAKSRREPSPITLRDISNKQFSSVWSPDDEESDDEDLVSTFYNDTAGKSNITSASEYDKYGNPTERIYDLGRDGAYTEFSILIAQFYTGFDMQKPIDALKVKGFQVKHVKTENECIKELTSNRYQIVWIISTCNIQSPSFISALTTYHSSGGAIFLFADNTPYVCHASDFLKTKFGITVEGDYYGCKTLTYKEKGHQQAGHFGQHDIFTGIANLYEGETICHPVYSTPTSCNVFVTIATATDGNSSIAVYDPPTTTSEGRLCLDCGFTKLFRNWDSAGTARYVVNASCWLLGIEKHLKSKKKNKSKK